MKVAISGTPGTGKSSVACELSARDHRVIELGDLCSERGLLREMDEGRGSFEVDIGELDDVVGGLAGELILVGHLSHLLTVDMIILLRCSPSILRGRLTARGWPERKVRENMEAEACDVILIESFDHPAVFEIDTTLLSPGQTADAVEGILRGETGKYALGNIDWSEEVMDWF